MELITTRSESPPLCSPPLPRSEPRVAGLAGPVRLHTVVIVAYAVALAIVGSALIGHFGYPLDDSWIHQSVGRNFAHFGSLGYLPFERSSGSTSLLWTCILAAKWRLFPALSPVLFTLAINVMCVTAVGLMLLRVALNDGMSAPLAVLFAVAPALDGNYLWLAFTGMEHVLFVALSVGVVCLWMTPRTDCESWSRTIVCGVCMGLLSMTRPEGVVLPIILLASSYLAVNGRTRSNGQLLTATVLFAGLSSLPFVINLYNSRSLLPVTFKGRHWLFVSDAGGWLPAIRELLSEWSSRPFKAVAAFSGPDLTSEARFALILGLGVVLILSLNGVRALLLLRCRRLLILCAWAFLHALLYAFILPSSGQGGRYQPLQLLLLFPLVCLGIHQLLHDKARAAIMTPAAVLVTLGAISLSLWRSALASGVDHIAHTHAVAAAWLERNVPLEKVAIFDIGRIGYQRGSSGDPNIIDLGGLTDPGYTTYLLSGRVPAYLAMRGIHYLVLPTDVEGHSDIVARLHLIESDVVSRTLLYRACSKVNDWELGWLETRNALLCQEIDRVSFAVGN
jgi:hypothetical protein